MFATYEEAVAYAQSGIAYAGQLIAVVNDEAVNIYKIMGDKLLVAMGADSITMSNELPKPNGVASAGTSGDPARSDHVHQRVIPTAEEVGAVSTKTVLDGILLNDDNGEIYHYATCDAFTSYNNKGTTKAHFANSIGARITVHFTWGNILESPTLSVGKYDGDGIRLPIEADGDTVHVCWKAGDTLDFIHSAKHTWKIIGGYRLQGKPVGSIYISTKSTDPADLFGGSWAPIESGRYLKAITSGAAGPGKAGLPNITGRIDSLTGASYLPNDVGTSGALKSTVSAGSHNVAGQSSSKYSCVYIDFDASKSGTDSLYGKDTTVTPLN